MIDRRTLLLSGATTPALATSGAGATPPSGDPTLGFLLEMHVRVGPRQPLGPFDGGQRSVLPLLGGSFEGPRLRGVVLSGASRHLDRPGGAFSAEALYDLRTDDGVVISVRERAIIDAGAGHPAHGFSAVELLAPDGPCAWLNRCIVVGALGVVGDPPAVRLRLYALS